MAKLTAQITNESEILIIIGDGESVIPTGVAGDVQVRFPCNISEYSLLAEPSGSIKVDIWKDVYSNRPPTDADTICGGNDPEIVSGTGVEDTVLTGWTKTIAKGDILRFNVDSCSLVKRATLSLLVGKT